MLKLKDSMADVAILGYLRIRRDGKVLYFDPTEGNYVGATILRVSGLELVGVPSKAGEIIDVRVKKKWATGEKRWAKTKREL